MDGPAIVRIAQIPLSLASVWVLYLIGCRLFTPRVALMAAAACAHPSLLFSGVLVLETLFTLLVLTTILGCLVVIERPRGRRCFHGREPGSCGATRSVLWPFVIVLAGAAIVGLPGAMRMRLRVAALLFVGYALVVGPWSYRNTKLQACLKSWTRWVG